MSSEVLGDLELAIILAGLDEHREYNVQMERILQTSRSWREALVAKRAQGLPENLRVQFIARNAPRQWQSSFPDQHRLSVFIAAFAFFEATLVDLASRATREMGLNWSPPRKNRLDSARKMLMSSIKATKPTKEEWKPIGHMRSIRNHLLHRGFYIHESNASSATLSAIEFLPGIDLDEDGDAVIQSTFCEGAFDAFATILMVLREEVEATTNGAGA